MKDLTHFNCIYFRPQTKKEIVDSISKIPGKLTNTTITLYCIKLVLFGFIHSFSSKRLSKKQTQYNRIFCRAYEFNLIFLFD